MNRLCHAAAAALVLSMAQYLPAEDGPEGSGMLDGKTFTGELGVKGEDAAKTDTLIFSNGTFVSTGNIKHGFQAVPYRAHEIDRVITFTAKPKNAADETFSWIGSITDGTIEATAVHQTITKKTEYWFKGTLQPAQPEPPVLKPYVPE